MCEAEVNMILELKKGGILKTKEEILEILKKEPIRFIAELKNLISYKKEAENLKKENKEIKKELERLSKNKFTCPICFRKFTKPKSFTNHIREYRIKLEKYRRREKNDNPN